MPDRRPGELLIDGRVPHPPHPAQTGWHWAEWVAEAVGTALLLTVGLSAICVNFGPHHLPWSHSWRLLLTGLLFAGSGSLIAISKVGRRSGAHLNPSVTVAFYLQGHLTSGDVAGYITGQCVGALTGAAIVRLAWGHVGRDVHLGLTQPGSGIDTGAAVAIEAGMTAALILVLFGMVSSAKTMRFTPLVLWPVIATLVWQGARFTGTSLNPARSLGPAAVLPDFHDYWIYLVGPLLGAAGGWAIWTVTVSKRTVTAKLFHDPRYRSVLRADVPVAHQHDDRAAPVQVPMGVASSPPGRRPVTGRPRQ